jgi:hypothetical protein
MQVVGDEYKHSMNLIEKLSGLPQQNRDHALEYFGNVIAQLIDMPRANGFQFKRFHFTLDFDEETGMVGVQFLDNAEHVNQVAMADFQKLVNSRNIPHEVNDKDEVVMSTAQLFDSFFPKGHLDLLEIKTPRHVH